MARFWLLSRWTLPGSKESAEFGVRHLLFRIGKRAVITDLRGRPSDSRGRACRRSRSAHPETVSTGGSIPARRERIAVEGCPFGGHTGSRIRAASLRRESQWFANHGVGGGGGRQLSLYTVVTSGAVGGVGRVSGVIWLDGATRRGDLPQQRPGPHDLGSESLYPSAEVRVGGVDQGRRRIWECVHEFHDSIIRSISAAMSGVDHGEALGRQRHGGWLLPIEHNRPIRHRGRASAE